MKKLLLSSIILISFMASCKKEEASINYETIKNITVKGRFVDGSGNYMSLWVFQPYLIRIMLSQW